MANGCPEMDKKAGVTTSLFMTLKLLTFNYCCIESYTCIIISICVKYYKYLVPWSGYFGVIHCSIKIDNYLSLFTSSIIYRKKSSISFNLYLKRNNIYEKYISKSKKKSYRIIHNSDCRVIRTALL